jgi:hypothetical protein
MTSTSPDREDGLAAGHERELPERFAHAEQLRQLGLGLVVDLRLAARDHVEAVDPLAPDHQDGPFGGLARDGHREDLRHDFRRQLEQEGQAGLRLARGHDRLEGRPSLLGLLRADARLQHGELFADLLVGERADDEVARAQPHRLLGEETLVGGHRQHDRHPARRLLGREMPQQGVAVHPGQVPVGQDEVVLDPSVLERVRHGHAVDRLEDLLRRMPQLLEDLPEHLPHRGGIVGQEYSHGAPSRPRPAVTEPSLPTGAV